MNWIILITTELLSIFLMIFSYKKWKYIAKHSSIDDNLVTKRKTYRNIYIFGMLLLVAGFDDFVSFYDSTSGYCSIIVIAMMMSNSRVFFEPYFKSEIANSLKNFCLYLRPFSADLESKRKNRHGFVKDVYGLPQTIERMLCKEIAKQIFPVYAIGNPNSNVPTTIMTSNIYANDEEWKTTIDTLSNNAELVVLRVGESEGCLWEIKNSVDNMLLKKIVFIIEDETMLSVLNKNLPSGIPDLYLPIKENTSSYVVYLDENCNNWNYAILNSYKDIKIVVSNYIKGHPSLKNGINVIKARRKNLKVLFDKGKIPAILWQILSILLNPIAYSFINKWQRKWYIILIAYCFIAICILLSIFLVLSELTTIVIAIALFLPWIWLAPRISWRTRQWESEVIFSKKNKALALWLLVYSLLSTVIGLFNLE